MMGLALNSSRHTRDTDPCMQKVRVVYNRILRIQKIRTIRNKLTLLQFKKENAQIVEAVKRIEKEKLTYLDLGELCELSRVALANEKHNIEGIVVEAGCALGGSAIALANAKNKSRPFYVYDVFGTIPPPSDKDGSDVHERYAIIASGKSEGIGTPSLI